MTPHEIAKTLDDARKTKGLTRRELARRAKVDPGQLSRILKGQFERLSGGALLRTCRALDIELRQSGDPRSNAELMAALAAVWDGSEMDAKRISDFLHAFGRARTFSSPEPANS